MSITTNIDAREASQCSFTVNAPTNNYITVLHGVNQILTSEFNDVRSKWRDIQKTEELTSKVSDSLDKLTNNTVDAAKRLKNVQDVVKEKSENTNELTSEVEALRVEYNNITNIDKWSECEEGYLREQSSIAGERVKQLMKEKAMLEHQTAVVRSKYKWAVVDLVEADEKLRSTETFTEQMVEENKMQMLTWQQTDASSKQETDVWKKKNLDIREEVATILPVDGEMKIIKKDVSDLQEKVTMMQKRKRIENREYGQIKLQCIKAAKRIRELELALTSKNENCKSVGDDPKTAVTLNPKSQSHDVQTSTEEQEVELALGVEQISTTIFNLDETLNPNTSNNGQEYWQTIAKYTPHPEKKSASLKESEIRREANCDFHSDYQYSSLKLTEVFKGP